jgi:hypothetical protein
MLASEERLARNQSLFREVNEQIEEITPDGEELEFVCECSNTDCISNVPLTHGEYERIRPGSTWFFVVARHEMPYIERVVSWGDGYLVVGRLSLALYWISRANGTSP